MNVTSNLLFTTAKLESRESSESLLVICCRVGAKCSIGNSFGSKLQQHTACDGNLDETFTRLSENQEPLILPHASFSLFSGVYVCMPACVCV